MNRAMTQSVRPRSRWLALAAAGAVSLLALELVSTFTTLGSEATSSFIGEWTYHLLMAGAAVAVIVRVAVVAEHRLAWGSIALGLLAWNAGDVYYYTVLAKDPPIPFPSLSDGLFLLLYVGFLAGLGKMGGSIRKAGPVPFAVVVCLLGMTSIWSWLVFGGVLDSAEGNGAAIATTAAYPMLDLLLLASALIAIAARGWRLDRVLVSMIVGFALIAVGDLIYAAQVAQGNYVDGTALDALWPAGALGVALAAWLPAGRGPTDGISGQRLVPILTASAAAVASALLIWDHFEPQHPVTLVVAGTTLAAALVQLLLLFGDRTRSQSQARVAERLRSASAEAALDCVVTIDASGVIREWNAAASHTFGYQRLEALGRDLAGLIIPRGSPENHGGFLQTLDMTGHGPILNQRIEVMATHARGGSFPVELAVARIQDDPPMYSAFLRDISGRRRRGEENERFAAIIRSSTDAIHSRDLSGIVTAWNTGAEKLYGYTAAEAIGKPVKELIIPEERTKEVEELDRKVLSGNTETIFTQRLTKDGDYLDVALRAFPVLSLTREVRGVSVSARDITDLRLREQQEQADAQRKLWRRRTEEALAHDRLIFWGQPVINLRTAEVDHYELLLRMNLDGRTVSPGEFLPHAESSHLITEIDHWAITRGVELGRGVPVAINLSAKSLSTRA